MMEIAGVWEKVDAAGFTSRRGAMLRWGAEDWTIDWAEFFGADERGWQVERAEFDEILLRHAQELGVEVVESAHVRRSSSRVIPLREGRFSIGFVTHKIRFVERRKEFASDDEMLRALVQESETVRKQLAGAEFIGPTRVEQHYSYVDRVNVGR
ncbi:NAD(P)/FAD-dependent oxidoreductase [Streptomyces sp. G5(2025)]|uniref:NAD(P)/FAD-dependent oxidoreductase n=1 Tax=Streptomyces sp. G5(2025) TaxID=3406628 RepID=UPI003C21253D